MRLLIQVAASLFFLNAVDSKYTVLVLGGGVTGVIAARTLHQHGIDNFVIIEGRHELGGRMQTHNLSGTTIERGPNWIQGTQQGDGPINPILSLAKKWDVKTQFNDLYGSITTYDSKGAVDFLDVFNDSVDDFVDLTIGAGARVNKSLVDAAARAGFSLAGVKPKSQYARAAEYYQYDFEYAQTPEQSSWLASSWNNNFTYDPDQGGFADENLLAIDQRGFKHLIQAEADDFLRSDQLMLGSTVREIQYSSSGVKIILTNNKTISGDYALCTFSLGVLQNDDVKFRPTLPNYKQEAIESMTMATYTKIFIKFPKKFWFDTEMGLYADSERGRYPVWQSLDHATFLPDSGILFVTVTGDYSVRIEAMSDSQVQAEVMDTLKHMFPHVAIPVPIDFYFPRWHSDPLFRGSYSNWPASFVPQHQENLRANVERLFFAGEATSLRYYGFLHGAYFEGFDVATVMANCIKSGDRSCAGLASVNQVKNTDPYNLTGPLAINK
ncbi:amine oxidase [Mycena floridula]|nr:amine oxidase [Mycena floridula]